MNARFVPSEYGDIGDRIVDRLFWPMVGGLSTIAGATFGVNPLVLKPILPNATYAQRTVLGLILLVPEFYAARYFLNRKSA